VSDDRPLPHIRSALATADEIAAHLLVFLALLLSAAVGFIATDWVTHFMIACTGTSDDTVQYLHWGFHGLIVVYVVAVLVIRCYSRVATELREQYKHTPDAVETDDEDDEDA
jgi:hypothetical protein